jgi:putative ABC transport system ATP-binding protein
MLEIKNLSKCFDDGKSQRYVLDKIDLTVPDHEFIAIVGSSGAGKSTLLNIISGIESPSEGKILLNGKNYADLGDNQLTLMRRRQISVIYQFFNLVSVLNVTDNIRLPLLLDKKECADKDVAAVLKMLNISQLKDKFPTQLSGGEQQRVAIARALISKPDLLLADEPTGNLDKVNSEEVARQLRKANEEYGLTIIMVTHDMNIASYANRIIRLDDGHIVSDEVVQK